MWQSLENRFQEERSHYYLLHTRQTRSNLRQYRTLRKNDSHLFFLPPKANNQLNGFHAYTKHLYPLLYPRINKYEIITRSIG